MLERNTNKGQQKIKRGRNKIRMRTYEKDRNMTEKEAQKAEGEEQPIKIDGTQYKRRRHL